LGLEGLEAIYYSNTDAEINFPLLLSSKTFLNLSFLEDEASTLLEMWGTSYTKTLLHILEEQIPSLQYLQN
jgi:hypothetical protein